MPSLFQMSIRRIEIFYEALFGLDFLIVNSLEDLGLDSKLVSKCSPSGNKFLKNVFLDLNVTTLDSVLDIGCGKGSALRVSLKFDFSKVDGVELSEYLSLKAVRNFKILKQPKPKIFNNNVLEFNNYNDYNFFYLYNPFPSLVFKEFLKIINKQVKAKK